MSARLGSAAVLDNPQVLRYADGADIYQFLGSTPAGATDPTGMDRYVGGGVHHYLAVDTWTLVKNKNGHTCWKKSGVAQYDFRLRLFGGDGADTLIFGFLFQAGGALTFSAAGEVSGIPYSNAQISADGAIRIPSTPEADEMLKAALDERAANPPNYEVFLYNCNTFVRTMGEPWDR